MIKNLSELVAQEVRSWVDEGDHDVSRSLGGVHALVEVGQAAGVHEHPALLRVLHGAVVAQEAAAAALVVLAGLVEREVDGVGRGVVVRSQVGLLVGPVADDEVHQRSRRVVVVAEEDGLLERADVVQQEAQPHLLQSDLIHVDVPRRHCLIATLQPLVAVRSIGPLAMRLDDRHQVVAEFLGRYREPVDVRAGLLIGLVWQQ